MKKIIFLILIVLLCISSLALISCGGEDDTTTTAEPLNKPTFEIVDLQSTRTTVSFEITETDPDNAGEIKSIELYQNGVKVKTAESIDARKFSNLTQNTKYTVNVTYSYDLQNGEGEKTDSVSIDVSTTNEGFSSKTNVKKDWEGKTLNVACTTWSSAAGAPWSVVELCVEDGKESGFGTKIDAAVLERQEFIKSTYGVNVNWINCGQYDFGNELNKAEIAGNVSYDIALPRALRVQRIVANGLVYDIGNRDYIDFSNPYYNKDSVDTYTAMGHTFFVDGDFSTLSKEVAKVLYFNKKFLGGEKATAELYQKVREGKWTWDQLVALGTSVYKDDGDGKHSENDMYGLDKLALYSMPYSFGVKTVGIDKSTGEWKLSLKDSEIYKIVAKLHLTEDLNWLRPTWNSSTWGENGAVKALKNETLLFLRENVRLSSYEKLEGIGVVPFPMLNEEQGRYCVPLDDRYPFLMCIPKSTQDRFMSDYFVDVLSWTGSEYTMKAYLEQKAEAFESDADIEMLVNCIFPSIIHNAGVEGWNNVLSVNINNGIEEFDKSYNKEEPEALETIKEWNKAWGSYTEN